ncbi:hypothetical protein KEM55_007652, partial [Ascosphaera atra]
MAATVDIPFLAAHYSVPDTTLTSLTQNPTVELVNELLTSIGGRAREFEELKSDKLRLEVELENSVRTSDSKLKVLKNTAQKHLNEVTELRTKLQDAENARSSLQSELDTIKSSSSSSQSEVSSLKS